MSTLASQLPELRAPLQRASPLDTSPADAADGDAAAVSAAAVGAALSFFDERLGCVQLQWRNKLRRVFFPLPPLCLGLPVALRAKAALPQRTFSSLTAEAKLRDFCRRCRATLKQLEYQRSLSHFGVLSTLTSRLAPLMWAQLALVAIANLLLLAAALPSANDDGADAAAATAYSQANASAPWPPAPPPAFPPPSPPPPASPPAGGGEPPSAFLAMPQLVLASLLLGLYVLRFGPTLISARAIAAGEPRDAAAAPPRRLLVPLLLRMRLPVPLWLPFLHAAHEGQRLWRELDLDVRAIALGEPRPDERPPHPLAQALFVVLCARALLGDPLLLALGAQLVCAALRLRGALFEPPALLFAVLACCAPARQLAAAAAAPAAVALALVALLAHFFAALSVEGPLASSCNGTYGGPWECASQSECVAAALHLTAQPQPPREECIEGAVGVEPPAFAVGFALSAGLVLLGVGVGLVREHAASVLRSLSSHAAAAGAQGVCFISGLPLERLGQHGAGLSPTPRPEHYPWHYCCWVISVLAKPPPARSALEGHCASLLLRDDVSWLPTSRALSIEERTLRPKAELDALAASADALARKVDEA